VNNYIRDFPEYSVAILKEGCIGSVDLQSNFHNFCFKNGDTQTVYYEFYDKANPTVPIYEQTLP